MLRRQKTLCPYVVHGKRRDTAKTLGLLTRDPRLYTLAVSLHSHCPLRSAAESVCTQTLRAVRGSANLKKEIVTILLALKDVDIKNFKALQAKVGRGNEWTSHEHP